MEAIVLHAGMAVVIAEAVADVPEAVDGVAVAADVLAEVVDGMAAVAMAGTAAGAVDVTRRIFTTDRRGFKISETQVQKELRRFGRGSFLWNTFRFVEQEVLAAPVSEEFWQKRWDTAIGVAS